MSAHSISLGFLSRIRPGDVLLVDPPPPPPPSSSSSSSSAGASKPSSSAFHAMVSTIFFVEEPHQKENHRITVHDGDHKKKEQQEEKESGMEKKKRKRERGGEDEKKEQQNGVQAEVVRVSLLATVYRPETPTVPPLLLSIASAVFSSSLNENEETKEEKCEVAVRLRMPLIFQSGHQAPCGASASDFAEGVKVQQLQVEVEKVDPRTGARTGVYDGPRIFSIGLAGLQNTTLSNAQIQLLLQQGGEAQKKGKTTKNHADPHKHKK